MDEALGLTRPCLEADGSAFSMKTLVFFLNKGYVLQDIIQVFHDKPG